MAINKRPIVIRFVVGGLALAMMLAMYLLLPTALEQVDTEGLPRYSLAISARTDTSGAGWEQYYANTLDSLNADSSIALGFLLGHVVLHPSVGACDSLAGIIETFDAPILCVPGEDSVLRVDRCRDKLGFFNTYFQQGGDNFIVLGGPRKQQELAMLDFLLHMEEVPRAYVFCCDGAGHVIEWMRKGVFPGVEWNFFDYYRTADGLALHWYQFDKSVNRLVPKQSIEGEDVLLLRVYDSGILPEVVAR